LLFVGDGPERPHAESMCRELGICDDVRFVGRQEQIEEILAISDLFLLPSDYESFGLAALEAMAASVPVISTNAGGLPEINIQGKTGFLSDVGNVKEMAANAITLLENEELLKQISKNASEQADKFDIHNVIPIYETLYDKFLATPSDRKTKVVTIS
jgi:N-acetyl-alpha-D-glucosaminyl L-malate synthase BshA